MGETSDEALAGAEDQLAACLETLEDCGISFPKPSPPDEVREMAFAGLHDYMSQPEQLKYPYPNLQSSSLVVVKPEFGSRLTGRQADGRCANRKAGKR